MLEQDPDVAAYAPLSSAEAADRSYDEEKVGLHLKLAVAFQGQSPSPAAAYDTTVKYQREDIHPHL